MTKTVQTQIDKSRNLIEGLRKHIHEGGGGITLTELDSLEKELKAVEEASDDCERLRAELGPKVKRMNDLLAGIKDKYQTQKLIIKNRYPQERWADYGLPDKR